MPSILSLKTNLFNKIKITTLSLYLCFLPFFSYAIENNESNNNSLKLLQPGMPAPVNVLKDVYDEDHSFPLLNKWNMVFYWSLFCHSCIEEMPEIQEGLEKIEGKDFATYFVSLDTEKMKKALVNFKKRRKFLAPILMEKLENDKYITADTWGVTMTPSVFIINPQGKVIFSHQGPLDIDLFFKNLPQELLGAPKEKKEDPIDDGENNE